MVRIIPPRDTGQRQQPGPARLADVCADIIVVWHVLQRSYCPVSLWFDARAGSPPLPEFNYISCQQAGKPHYQARICAQPSRSCHR